MYPPPPGMVPQPQITPIVLPAAPYPTQPPPGYAMLCVDFNRGPYLMPAAATMRFKVSGHEPPSKLNTGRWYLPVLPGTHPVKVTDLFGIPVITTQLTLQPGLTHYLRFHFGGWRNRVYDAGGNDVTRFGMWSNYLILLITFGAVALVCCLPFLIFGVFAS